MQVMRTVLDMAMESGPARLAMIVAAIAFTQVKMIIWFHMRGFGFKHSVVMIWSTVALQTTFLNFTYFLSYNRANLIGAGAQ